MISLLNPAADEAVQQAPGRVWTWPTSQANSLPELAARPKDLLLNAMTSVVLTCSAHAAREHPWIDAAGFLPKNLKQETTKPQPCACGNHCLLQVLRNLGNTPRTILRHSDFRMHVLWQTCPLPLYSGCRQFCSTWPSVLALNTSGFPELRPR